MKYKNKKTGVVIEVASVCHGEDWEEVSEVVAKPKRKTKKKEVVNNERPVNE